MHEAVLEFRAHALTDKRFLALAAFVRLNLKCWEARLKWPSEV